MSSPIDRKSDASLYPSMQNQGENKSPTKAERQQAMSGTNKSNGATSGDVKASSNVEIGGGAEVVKMSSEIKNATTSYKSSSYAAIFFNTVPSRGSELETKRNLIGAFKASFPASSDAKDAKEFKT